MSWLSFEVCRRNQHLLFLILPLSVAAIPNASFEFSLELQKAASIALSGCSRPAVSTRRGSARFENSACVFLGSRPLSPSP